MSRSMVTAAVVGAIATSPSAGDAQVRQIDVLTLNAAMSMADAAVVEARANGWEVVIAIVDASGELVLLRRMDGAQVGSVDVATAKASTAARFRRETKAFADAIAGGNLAMLSIDGVIALEGGLPITHDGVVIGGIGVSGVQSHEDAQIGRAGLTALAGG